MLSKSFWMTEPLDTYVCDNWLREPDLLRELREETAERPNAGLQISPDQGPFMAMLAKVLGVRRYLEIGVFTGYSSLSVGLAMPEDGRIVACDISEDFTTTAQKYWSKAGLRERVDLRIGPASDSLSALMAEGAEFDMAFIDADKSNYRDYYEKSLAMLRSGGLILIDNVLWHGRVIDPDLSDPDTVAILELNAFLKTDERIDLCLVPIADGVTMARKR